MSGNSSRKYKQYIAMQEKRKLFGSISARDEYGIHDPVASLAGRTDTLKQSRAKTEKQRVKGNTKI